jgi:hypothetical protein
MKDSLMLAACAYLKADPGRVLVYRLEAEEVVLVVDNGIAGCPKYRVPLSKLQPDKPAAAPKGKRPQSKGKPVKPPSVEGVKP